MFANTRNWCVCIAAMLLALSASVAGAAERSGPGTPDPKDPVLAPRPALVSAPKRPRTAPAMTLRQKPAADPAKAEYFVDAGLNLPPAEPTDRERAKLEAARVAVEAARASRAALGTVSRDTRTLPPLYQIEANKLERLRNATPAPVTSSPEAMGQSADPRSRQKQGPAGLSEREQAKAKAKPASSVTPEPQREGSR